jgi:hypothetical protein
LVAGKRLRRRATTSIGGVAAAVDKNAPRGKLEPKKKKKRKKEAALAVESSSLEKKKRKGKERKG